jgi:hypothetical protein
VNHAVRDRATTSDYADMIIIDGAWPLPSRGH